MNEENSSVPVEQLVRVRIYDQGSEFCVIAELELDGRDYRASSKCFQIERGVGRALRGIGQQLLDATNTTRETTWKY